MLLTTMLQVSANWSAIAGAIGAAIAVIGGAYGISKIGATALEGSARQPEAAGNIRTSMLIVAALVEGVALFGVVTCLLIGLQ